MCGIVALISPDHRDHQRFDSMLDKLIHRGPDAHGTYKSDCVALGHRRLSIIDLSEAARQPLSNEDGTVHLVCNGEIYNHRQLRSDLQARGHIFHSRSDNEVLLHLYEEYGENLLDPVNGMFAFVIWDARKRHLLAAVDRFGKKPLYISTSGGRLAIASEMKSLLLLPWVDQSINFTAIDRYLTFRHIPAPLTPFRGISKLEPAKMLTFSGEQLEQRLYWKAEPTDSPSTFDNAVDAVEELLLDAVSIRLDSDVPLGLYLSGGIDSALIAGMMNKNHPVRKVAYSVSFNYQFDERAQAQACADHLGFDFNPVVVSPDDFDALPDIVHHLDEPYGDLIVLPAWRLAKTAKENLTVVLTGDGADEIFGGYLHQKMMFHHRSVSGLLRFFPLPMMLSRLVNFIPASWLDRLFDYPDRLGVHEKAKFVRAIAQSGHFGDYYEGITSCFTAAEKTELYTSEFLRMAPPGDLAGEYEDALMEPQGFNFLSRLSLMDIKYWLPFILRFRLDKLNMAHAIENRSPYLDYRLVQLALSLPDSYKLGGRSKKVLRQVHERLFPPHLHVSGKQAFYMPFLDTHRNKRSEWFADTLSQKSLESRGLFQPRAVSALSAAANEGSMLANRQLVALAMLEEWFRSFVD